MTQPTADFGTRPEARVEPPSDLPSFRLGFDEVVDFGRRRLAVAPELTNETIAALDRALDEGATWSWVGPDIAALSRESLTVRGFAHGVGPAAHEAVDAPWARQCVMVHRLGLWLTERRPGEGYVACLLRHITEDGQELRGLVDELAQFRESRRPKAPPSDLPAGVRRGRGAAAGEPYDYVIEADPGLEGMPVRGPWDSEATEVAQAIGSHPEVQGPWLPGDNLRPLIDVIRDRLAAELEKRGLVDDDETRPWLAPFVRFVEADDDALLDFDGNTAPARLQRILQAAYGGGIDDLLGHDCARPEAHTAHTDATSGDTAVILDDVDVDEPASGAVRELAKELGRQLGRPRDEHGHRHFDAQALTAAALRGAGVAERPADRRMLEVDGQTIRTADGEEVVAMCSERSWARLLVDAWHTFPLTDPDAPVEGRDERRRPGSAWDGGTIPADVGWTLPLTSENAAELEARGIDIVGAPISSPLCTCGHERAMHHLVMLGSTEQPTCSVLSSVPGHDCTGFVRALERDDPAAATVAPESHNGHAPPPGFRADGHEERCEASEQEACGCLEALVEALSLRGVIYGQAMVLRSLNLYAARSLAEAIAAALEGGWEPSPALRARLEELRIVL
jgi:hypothetical protein